MHLEYKEQILGRDTWKLTKKEELLHLVVNSDVWDLARRRYRAGWESCWIIRHWTSQHERTNGSSFLSCSCKCYNMVFPALEPWVFYEIWGRTYYSYLQGTHCSVKQRLNVITLYYWDVMYLTWVKEGVSEPDRGS